LVSSRNAAIDLDDRQMGERAGLVLILLTQQR
jgi:hypothetical protein